MSVVVWSRLARPLFSGVLLVTSASGAMAFEDGYEETIRTTRGVYVMRGNARADEYDDVASSSITATTPDGRVLFHRMTDLRPGCEGFTPRLVDIGPEHRRTRIVLLCGSSGGPHETLFAFVDGTGLVDEVDGDRSSPSPYLSPDGDLYAHAYRMTPIDGVDGLYPVPTQYRLQVTDTALTFVPVRDAAHSRWAKEMLEEFASDLTDGTYGPGRLYIAAHALLGSNACSYLLQRRPDLAALMTDPTRLALNRWLLNQLSLKGCD